jgi:hypothetical protein
MAFTGEKVWEDCDNKWPESLTANDDERQYSAVRIVLSLEAV